MSLRATRSNPEFKAQLEPTPTNGINTTSHIMVDKCFTTPRDKIGKMIGHADSKTMLAIERALAVFIEIG